MLKAGKDLILKGITTKQLFNRAYSAIKNSNLETKASGVIKLKLFFNGDLDYPCVHRSGIHNLFIHEDHLLNLATLFVPGGTFMLANHLGNSRDTKAILYLIIENGQLESIRNVNFRFQIE